MICQANRMRKIIANLPKKEIRLSKTGRRMRYLHMYVLVGLKINCVKTTIHEASEIGIYQDKIRLCSTGVSGDYKGIILFNLPLVLNPHKPVYIKSAITRDIEVIMYDRLIRYKKNTGKN